jgi:microcystin-dependent protein
VTNTGGQERVTLTGSQIPDHQHKGKAYYKASGGTAGSDESGLADNLYHENSGHTTNSGTTSVAAAGVLTSETVGTIGESHPNLPPYYGVYFIKRTVRRFYTAS